MSWKKNAADPFAGLNFERDMPLTPEDLEALARSRNLRPLSPEKYQEWVDLIVKHHGVGRPVTANNTDDDEPFTL
ncbi:MAG TPA: hypothetical protein VF432_24030 [Thermoanaerobaculia bacterium]